jgi:hypothetical protein
VPRRRARPCAARRRPHAAGPRRPRHVTPQDARRSRRALPHALAPLGSWESAWAPRCRVRTVPAGRAPWTAGLTAASQPYARRPRRPDYGCIFGVTATSPGNSSPIKADPTPRAQATVLPPLSAAGRH